MIVRLEGVDPSGTLAKLVRALGVEGMSGDESDWQPSSDNPNLMVKRRIVIEPLWRALWVRAFLSMLDDEYDWTLGKFAMGASKKRGAAVEPRYWYQNTHRDADAIAINKLPKNMYDEEWYARQDNVYVQTILHPRRTELTIPNSFNVFVVPLNCF